jgi:methionyl-tRNA formyltransferase
LLVQQPVAIEPDDTAETLMARLIPAGLAAMDETIARVAAGSCVGVPQTGTASYAPQLTKEDGHIDWKKPVHEVLNLIRGARPWPGAYALVRNGKLEGQRLKIHRAHPVTDVDPDTPGASIGRVIGLVRRSGFVVGCGTGRLLVEEVQPENRKPMPAWDFIQGKYLDEKSYFA